MIIKGNSVTVLLTFIFIFSAVSLSDIASAGALRVESMAGMSNYLEDSNSILEWPGAQYFYADYSSISFGDLRNTENSELFTGFLINKRVADINVVGVGLDVADNLERRLFSIGRKFDIFYTALTIVTESDGVHVYNFGLRNDISNKLYTDAVLGAGNSEYDSYFKFRMFYSPVDKVVIVPFWSWSEDNSIINFDNYEGVNQRVGLGVNLLTDGDTLLALAVENSNYSGSSFVVMSLAAERRMSALLSFRCGYRNQEVTDRMTVGIALHTVSCDVEALVKKDWIKETDCLKQLDDASENISIGLSVSVWH
ncbi:hypothetical protein HN388_01020 [bacterium]|jgi:hypothetical protein|nr:hypothetical protein [bacterium]MBT4292733.1 hypothetical protein [bacterium]MBT7310642.1 hypothetical protein [bacterium]